MAMQEDNFRFKEIGKDMIEKWNQFVYDLCDAKRRNVDEDEYHRLIEIQLQLLGWAKYRGEICHKPNIPIGNNNFIQPDILIKRDGEELFVVEVKRPVHTFCRREKQQLESYMRQRKIRFGIYIGEHIEVFYDTPESADAVSVMIIPLELDNQNGARFVELFGKETYSQESLSKFCEKQIAEQKKKVKMGEARKYLVDNAKVIIEDRLRKYLKDEYEESFSDDEVEEIITGLSISLMPNEVQKCTSAEYLQPVFDGGLSNIPVSISKKPAGKPSKYSLNGSSLLAANRFVFEVVKAFVAQHPDMSFSELERVFPSELQGSTGVIRSIDYLKMKNYKGQRFFDDASSILRSGDGVLFAVSTQWSYHNAPGFAEHAKTLGFTVEIK